ncbi:hypothetical protein IWW55_001522 [Coemansia sp. RSA 2706]|nr:hypothetical protein LPJ63_000137 [Coemansia sp. RSA 2711]KAJ2306289.1 hypothetical protein IWW55_001522 [Coemansia sp. RSA 2706]KAJ2328054.1 hypothetical protein IWW51_001406 [Coemansia sp. RSA 2702]
MVLVAADSGAQPRLSMVVLGVLAGVAGLWVYSATRDTSAGRQQQQQRRRQQTRHSHTDDDLWPADDSPRATLHRTRTIRRQRRQLSSDTIASELRDEPGAADGAGTGTAAQAAAATAGSRASLDLDVDLDAFDSGSESEASTDVDMRLLHLLCTISEDQARRNGVIHRGTTCSSCQDSPIRGVRFKCAQCANVDVCEACEAHDAHRHHVLLRIAVPLPPLMNPRVPLVRALYPGTLVPRELARDVRVELEASTCLDRIDIVSLYSEFCVLATERDGVEAITRDAFFACLGTFGARDSVLAARLFAYYDADGDGVITFPEMARGFAVYNKGSLEEKAPGVFRAYDVDGDGRLSRDDLRAMLEAFADASREITRNMVRTLEDDVLEPPAKLLPGQPLSAAFTAAIPADSPSGLDKEVSALRAEVHALRESAATAARRADAAGGAEPRPGAPDRAHSDSGSSAPSVAATTSATVGTIASARMPRRLSANMQSEGLLPEDVLAEDMSEGAPSLSRPVGASNSAAAAVAAFTDTICSDTATSVDLLAGDAAQQQQQQQQPPPLLPATMWHDEAEDCDWSVMEALCQDAIRLMIEEIFAEAAPKDPICMTYAEFFEYLKTNPNLAIYLEVLGTIF